MITVEGLGGKGTLWCALKFGSGPSTKNATVNAYTPSNLALASAPPFECYLPPVGGAGLWYLTDGSPYGPKVSKFEVGTLKGVTNSPDTPNPCEHSTITGSLVATNSDPTLRPHITWNVADYNKETPGSYQWFTPNGETLSFHAGRPAWTGSMLAYNRKGIKDVVPYDSLNYDVWYYNTFLLAGWCVPIGSSTPIYAHPARLGESLCCIASGTPGPVDGMFLQATMVHRLECKHVSANVWTETWVFEYHHNASYIPSTPVSQDTGYGYVVSAMKRVRTHRMSKIQSVNSTLFRAQIDTTEEVTYFGHDAAWPIATYFSGKESNNFSTVVTLLVLEPGISTGDTFLKEKLDAYCALAIPRAVSLYECKSATIARSSAIADVPGLDSNWLENLSQVGGTLEVVAPLVMGWKAIRSGDFSLAKRALASAYLSYKYVIAPGISDYHDVKSNFKTIVKGFTKYRFSNERRRGRYIMDRPACEALAKLTYTCTLNLQLKDSSIAAVFNALEKLGLDPSSGNVWDLIPLSFVLDWFTGIGPHLHKLDAMQNNIVLRNVRSRIESFKVQWPLTSNDLIGFDMTEFSVTEPLKYSWYDRRILFGVGAFNPNAAQSSDGLSASQMTQGAALLTLYKK